MLYNLSRLSSTCTDFKFHLVNGNSLSGTSHTTIFKNDSELCEYMLKAYRYHGMRLPLICSVRSTDSFSRSTTPPPPPSTRHSSVPPLQPPPLLTSLRPSPAPPASLARATSPARPRRRATPPSPACPLRHRIAEPAVGANILVIIRDIVYRSIVLKMFLKRIGSDF